MPKLLMLVGIPAAGKSTFIANSNIDWNRTVIASTDNYIERMAKEKNKTYSDVFQQEIKPATEHLNKTVADAIKNGYDIIWDQTNPSVKARKQKLNMIPDNYEKIAVFFPTPEEKELFKRLSSRPGKNIPREVINSMIASLTIPTKEEGFDEIIMAGN